MERADTVIGEVCLDLDISPDGKLVAWVGADPFEIEGGEQYPEFDLEKVVLMFLHNRSWGVGSRFIEPNAAEAVERLLASIRGELQTYEVRAWEPPKPVSSSTPQ